MEFVCLFVFVGACAVPSAAGRWAVLWPLGCAVPRARACGPVFALNHAARFIIVICPRAPLVVSQPQGFFAS
jgi:hypothetical protein